MDANLIYSLLLTGAGALASDVGSGFAKSGGKAAFDALKNLIVSKGAASVVLIDQAKENTAYADLIRKDLGTIQLANDDELQRLAQTVLAEIDKLPEQFKTQYAVDIDVIKAGGSLTFKNIEGVTAKSAASVGNMNFEGITKPGK